MRKRFNYLFFCSLLILYGIINIILFLLIDKAILDTKEFWLSWSMFTWGNILFDIVYFVYLNIKRINIATTPALLISVLGINFVFLLVNLVFVLSGVNETTIIITDSILAFIAIAITGYLFLASKSIANDDKKQEKEVFYIKDLESDISALFNKASDTEIKEALGKLLDDVKYSDPISDDSLDDIELDIKLSVSNINEIINKDNKEEILNKIKETKDLLAQRNLKVRNLK